MKKILYFLVLALLANVSLCQNTSNTDSLLKKLNSPNKNEPAYVNVLCTLCQEYTFSDPFQAIKYAEEGISLAKKNKFPTEQANCLYDLGVVYYYQGNYDKSLESYLKGLEILEILHSKTTGTKKKEVYKLMGDHLHDIGKVYNRLLQYENALKSFDRALVIFRELNYKRGISGCYNNMAGVYDGLKDFDKTLFYLQEALTLAEELGDKSRIATGITNIGLTYQIKGEYDKALKYLKKGLKLREAAHDTKGLAYSYVGIGQIYLDKKEPVKALEFLRKALEYSLKTNAKERIKESYASLSDAYAQAGNFKEAYNYHVLLMQLKDSLITEKGLKQAAEIGAKYENTKKEQQIKLLEKDKELQMSRIAKTRIEAKKQQVQKLAFATGFILIFILGIVVFRSYRLKQKDNQNLALQKTIIEEKNKDITDSIKYAKRIQEAILPPQHIWHTILPDSFVYYQPKDILSGDFYWIEQDDNAIYVAAVDCTGHGVPGALMSIVGFNLLNKAVLEQKLTKPSDILDQLNKWVSITLRQSMDDSSVRDGMDISLCRISKNRKTLETSAAFNSIYLIRNGILKEINGDKFPVGIFIDETMRNFTNNEIELFEGDILYLFTDGYADQFGGTKGKKFKYAKLKELMLSMHQSPIDEQKNILNDAFEKWRGDLEQVDDVCIIGIRL
ncbi:MAG: tetratricopeptide repeat protein [Bacteroidetes bacterium]|nr:tetratricopeptide repeat protein [Bacteroidota bacterium]